jgi:hypothetical protein
MAMIQKEDTPKRILVCRAKDTILRAVIMMQIYTQNYHLKKAKKR